MRKIIVCLGLVAGLLATTTAAMGEKLFDNWNPSSCGRSDHAGVHFARPARIDAIKLWYSWARNEGRAHFRIFTHHNHTLVTEGTLVRGSCHEMMPSWCDADAQIGIVVPPGDMNVYVNGNYLCQNPGSVNNGFMKVFGSYQ
jgi:hypothetical protein